MKHLFMDQGYRALVLFCSEESNMQIDYLLFKASTVGAVTNRYVPITNNINLKEFLSNHAYYSGSAENRLQVVI